MGDVIRKMPLGCDWYELAMSWISFKASLSLAVCLRISSPADVKENERVERFNS
jgi:hypothetical protein